MPGILVIAAAAAAWRLACYLAPLFTRIRKDRVLDNPTRARMRTLIEHEPGIHFSEIMRRMALGGGQAERHLQRLEDAGLLVKMRVAGYNCYFSDASSAQRLATPTRALKAARARQLLALVVERPGISLSDLSKAGIAAGVLHYHLRRLADSELIRLHREARAWKAFPTAQAQSALQAPA
ncbi:MAG TPA: hypothetical protein VI796_03710 [Candidatus Thermoplasmatota archaeon]|nr:hypothetical protein [Candidatus Thermoplasmatota archaeon]